MASRSQRKKRVRLKPWTPFQPARMPDDYESRMRQAMPDWEPRGEKVWLNSRYQVIARLEDTPWGEMTHLSIKRLDKAVIHDWRELQRIKNELCGPNREAVEIYPSEERLVDTSNQYHCWVLPEGHYVPFGFWTRLVMSASFDGSRQRGFDKEAEPTDLIRTKEELDAKLLAERKAKDHGQRASDIPSGESGGSGDVHARSVPLASAGEEPGHCENHEE